MADDDDDDVYWTPDLSRPIHASFMYDVGDHGWGNEELQCYTDSPNNSFVNADGDAIVIRALADADTGRMTSARLVSRQCLTYAQGYVEADIEAPNAKGIWYAFWLLPKPPFHWPYDGEVDIAEGWDAKAENGSCIHWGHFTAEEHDKHRIRYTTVHEPYQRHTYGFCWSPRGLLWFYDGRPIMRACVPSGIRPFEEFQVLLNIAMGGNVMNGSKPDVPSSNQMIVRGLKMCHTPPMGWDRFDHAWNQTTEGNTM